jgi:hypothetical protein
MTTKRPRLPEPPTADAQRAAILRTLLALSARYAMYAGAALVEFSATVAPAAGIPDETRNRLTAILGDFTAATNKYRDDSLPLIARLNELDIAAAGSPANVLVL